MRIAQVACQRYPTPIRLGGGEVHRLEEILPRTSHHCLASSLSPWGPFCASTVFGWTERRPVCGCLDVTSRQSWKSIFGLFLDGARRIELAVQDECTALIRLCKLVEVGLSIALRVDGTAHNLDANFLRYLCSSRP